MTGFTCWSVVYTDHDTGENCRVPCLDRRDAEQTADRLFDLHFGVRVVSTTSADPTAEVPS